MVNASSPTNEMPGIPREFRIRKEGWNYYEVPDWDIKVAVRQVLMLAVEVDRTKLRQMTGVEQPAGLMTVNSIPLSVVTSKERHPSAKPQPPPTMAEFDAHGQFLSYETIEECENEYLLVGNPERVFTTRVVVSGMRILPGRYDPAGYPFVHVQHSLVIGPAHPLSLRNGGER